MYKYNSNLIEINSLYVTNNNLLTVSSLTNTDRLFTLYNINIKITKWNRKVGFPCSYKIFETSTKFIGYQPNKQIFDICKDSGKISFLNLNFIPERLINEDLIGRFTDTKGKKYLTQLNTNSYTYENLIEGSYRVIGSSENVIVLIEPGKGQILYGFDLSTKTIKWKCNIESRVNNLSLTYRSYLIIGTSPTGFLCLDSIEGKILWQNENLAYLKTDNEKIFSLGATNYTVLDPSNGEVIKQINLEKQYQEHEIQNSAASYTVGENFIYFNDLRRAKVGILEKLSGQIIWTYKLPVAPNVTIPASNVPVVTNDKLFVLDSEGTLHIFEKEDQLG